MPYCRIGMRIVSKHPLPPTYLSWLQSRKMRTLVCTLCKLTFIWHIEFSGTYHSSLTHKRLNERATRLHSGKLSQKYVNLEVNFIVILLISIASACINLSVCAPAFAFRYIYLIYLSRQILANISGALRIDNM